jgi:hypothetical protein
MDATSLPRLVFDPDVVVEGIQQPGSAAGILIDCWLAGLAAVLTTDALAYATVDYLLDNFPQDDWPKVKRLAGALYTRARFVHVRYTWRTIKNDHADHTDHPVVNCAMNAAGTVVAFDPQDYAVAREHLGLAVLTPPELVTLLAGAPRSP